MGSKITHARGGGERRIMKTLMIFMGLLLLGFAVLLPLYLNFCKSANQTLWGVAVILYGVGLIVLSITRG